jgi:uncharacterized protein YgiM (DUF1202 family)
MKRIVRTTILVAAAFTAFAAPALADATNCTVTAEIRLRKSPSKKGHVIGVLKKDARVTAVGKCSGGWVKVASEDGLTGYLGGWALADASPKAAAASVVPGKPEVAKPEVVKTEVAKPEVVKTEAPAPVVAKREIPTNEHLAIQITQLRLNVLGLDRDMEEMKKDIKRIKVTVARTAQARKPNLRVAKLHKHLPKKG